MIPLVSVDPGKRAHYVARFNTDGILYDVREMMLTDYTFITECQILVVEMPQVYGGPRQEDPNDLIALAFSLGQFVSRCRFARFFAYYPRQWKGQTPKRIHHGRVWAALNAEERALFPPETGIRIARAGEGAAYASGTHNLLDAAGIGLFHLGRIRK